MGGKTWPQYVLLIGALVAIGLLTVQYLAKGDSTLEETRREVASIERGDFSAFVSLNDGAHKPSLSYGDTHLVEFSDWASRVETNNGSWSLWDGRFRVRAFDEIGEIVHSRTISSFEIWQVTRLEDDHIVVSYYVAPDGREEFGPLALTIGHYRWYFADVTVYDGGATLSIDSEPRQFWFRQQPRGRIEVFSDGNGQHSFTTEYELTDVPLGERTLIAREEIWLSLPEDEG